MKISIILPVRNEESSLPGAIARLRAGAGAADDEIIVVDGQSSDRSLELARRLADLALELPEPGRARQMHAGALAASGELLLFLHADTELPPDWRAGLCRAWAQGEKPAAAAFKLGFDDERLFYRMLAAAANWRTRWTGVPLGDQAISIEKTVYQKAGGFPDVPLMEEYLLFRRLKGLGPVRILDQALRTSTRRYERRGRLFNSLRNVFITALYYLGVPPRVLARLYR